MPADNKTLQPASKRASQHASPISGVTDSTGFLRGQQVNNVGWVGLGLVHEAARRASLIMSSTDNVQASYNYILTFLAFTREFRSFYTFSGLNVSYLFICSSLHCTFSLFQYKAVLSREFTRLDSYYSYWPSDVITCAKFQDELFGFTVLQRASSFPFSIDFCMGLTKIQRLWCWVAVQLCDLSVSTAVHK